MKHYLQITNVNDLEQLSFIPKLLYRRIKKELTLHIDKYNLNELKNDNILVEYENEENKEKVFNEIKLHFYEKNVHYMFIINSEYPFKPPKLMLNCKCIYDFLNLKSQRFKKLMQYISGKECLCCDTYLCEINWGPAITLEHIITQMKNYKTLKQNICLKIIIEQIKTKYLNMWIDLDSWLFNVYGSDPNLCYPSH
jgi:ubiquitin-protein ligase